MEAGLSELVSNRGQGNDPPRKGTMKERNPKKTRSWDQPLKSRARKEVRRVKIVGKEWFTSRHEWVLPEETDRVEGPREVRSASMRVSTRRRTTQRVVSDFIHLHYDEAPLENSQRTEKRKLIKRKVRPPSAGRAKKMKRSKIVEEKERGQSGKRKLQMPPVTMSGERTLR